MCRFCHGIGIGLVSRALYCTGTNVSDWIAAEKASRVAIVVTIPPELVVEEVIDAADHTAAAELLQGVPGVAVAFLQHEVSLPSRKTPMKATAKTERPKP
jgi:hypothetical protein